MIGKIGLKNFVIVKDVKKCLEKYMKICLFLGDEG